jgi:hypothetical protein
MIATRPPAVAGMFYPGDPPTLTATVDALLGEASSTTDRQPKALIVPHAGYIYSGSTAAAAYASLAPWAASIHRVILLGPTHRVAVEGIALPEAEAFATPLGTIRLDAQAITVIADLPQIVFSDKVHAFEHSLEVHLPFLQRVLDNSRWSRWPSATLHPEAVAEVLDLLWGGPANADRRQLRPVAFPALRHGAAGRQQHLPAHPATRRSPQSRTGLRRLSDQRPATRRPPSRPEAATARPVQLGRHGWRQEPRRRLRLLCLQRANRPCLTSAPPADAGPQRHRRPLSVSAAPATVDAARAAKTRRHLRHADPARPAARLHRQPRSLATTAQDVQENATRRRLPRPALRAAERRRTGPNPGRSLAADAARADELHQRSRRPRPVAPGRRWRDLQRRPPSPTFLPQVWEQLPEPRPSWPISSRRPGCRPATGGRMSA